MATKTGIINSRPELPPRVKALLDEPNGASVLRDVIKAVETERSMWEAYSALVEAVGLPPEGRYWQDNLPKWNEFPNTYKVNDRYVLAGYFRIFGFSGLIAGAPLLQHLQNPLALKGVVVTYLASLAALAGSSGLRRSAERMCDQNDALRTANFAAARSEEAETAARESYGDLFPDLSEERVIADVRTLEEEVKSHMALLKQESLSTSTDNGRVLEPPPLSAA